MNTTLNLPPDLLEPEFLAFLTKHATDDERRDLHTKIRALLAMRGPGDLETSYDRSLSAMFPAYVTDDFADFHRAITAHQQAADIFHAVGDQLNEGTTRSSLGTALESLIQHNPDRRGTGDRR